MLHNNSAGMHHSPGDKVATDSHLISVDSQLFLEMSSSAPLLMSSNAAPSPGRSAAKCLNRIVKLSGSTSALGVVVATGVIEEVDVAEDGKGAQPLELSTIWSMESLEEATMVEEVVDIMVTQEDMEEEVVVDVER